MHQSRFLIGTLALFSVTCAASAPASTSARIVQAGAMRALRECRETSDLTLEAGCVPLPS